MHHPTDSIDIYFTEISPLSECLLIINNEIYKHLKFDEIKIGRQRIKCKSIGKDYFGPQNTCLSDYINENTINFSRIDCVKLIVNNCSIQKINQNVFITYLYPDREKIFT